MGIRYVPDNQTELLDIDRGGIRVSSFDDSQYEQLVAALRAHAKGEFTYAAPDCPEVYFLSGLRNPTRTLYDFLDDAAGRAGRVLEALERYHVNVVLS